MNAGIVSLVDGTPCIVFDEELPYEVSHIEFNEETHQISLMYAIPGGRQEGRELAYPMDPPFTALLRERGDVAVAYMKDKQVVDLRICIVKFVTK